MKITFDPFVDRDTYGRAARILGRTVPENTTPVERRAALAVWGREDLLKFISPEAGARYSAWSTWRDTHPDEVPELEAFGPPRMVDLLLGSFEQLPQPVRVMTALETRLNCIGIGWKGSHGPPPDLSGKYVITVGGVEESDVVETWWHECAHHHLARPLLPGHTAAPTRIYERALALAHAERWPVIDGLDEREAAEHQLVDLLVMAWMSGAAEGPTPNIPTLALRKALGEIEGGERT